MPREDRELVDASIGGDQQACTALVEAYVRMVGTVIWRATGRRDVIQDLTQETFLRVFKALAYFDSRARLSTWIYTIVPNVAIDHLRKAGAATTESLNFRDDDGEEIGEERQIASTAPDPELLLARDESERLVRDGLARLP